jgi:hypothetical protein
LSDDPGGGASRSTDPARGSSEGTDVSLREYLHAEIQAVERRSEARFESMQRAVDLALEATERRFEGVNEFRATLSDQAANFVTRDAMTALGEKLQASIDRNASDLRALSQKIDLREGEESGARITKGTLYSALIGATLILGVIIALANYLTHR